MGFSHIKFRLGADAEKSVGLIQMLLELLHGIDSNNHVPLGLKKIIVGIFHVQDDHGHDFVIIRLRCIDIQILNLYLRGCFAEIKKGHPDVDIG